MASHRIQKSWKAKLKRTVPFGLGQVKPKHFRDMAGIALRSLFAFGRRFLRGEA